MEGITIITAFFDIGRENFKLPRCAPRSVQKYMDYFDFWARIQNDVVIYTSPEYKQQVLSIRKRYGREQQTTVVEIENIFDVEKEIFDRMVAVEKKPDFKKFRFWNEEVSNRADYDYIMLMKYWCVVDAVQRKLTGETLFWMDFGYNHGGECFVNPEEFNFKLVSRDCDKIQLSCLPGRDIQQSHSAISLQYQFDTICGCLLVIPASVAENLWTMVRNAMLSLLSLDCIDDDQQLLLMSYKLYPDFFDVTVSNWFMPIKELYGGGHLSTRENNSKKSFVKKVYGRIRGLGRILRFLSRMANFITRVEGFARKYYG